MLLRTTCSHNRHHLTDTFTYAIYLVEGKVATYSSSASSCTSPCNCMSPVRPCVSFLRPALSDRPVVFQFFQPQLVFGFHAQQFSVPPVCVALQKVCCVHPAICVVHPVPVRPLYFFSSCSFWQNSSSLAGLFQFIFIVLIVLFQHLYLVLQNRRWYFRADWLNCCFCVPVLFFLQFAMQIPGPLPAICCFLFAFASFIFFLFLKCFYHLFAQFLFCILRIQHLQWQTGDRILGHFISKWPCGCKFSKVWADMGIDIAQPGCKVRTDRMLL